LDNWDVAVATLRIYVPGRRLLVKRDRSWLPAVFHSDSVDPALRPTKSNISTVTKEAVSIWKLIFNLWDDGFGKVTRFESVVGKTVDNSVLTPML
jgi:hypothetical protein